MAPSGGEDATGRGCCSRRFVRTGQQRRRPPPPELSGEVPDAEMIKDATAAPTQSSTLNACRTGGPPP
jgi:hypothetical protein